MRKLFNAFIVSFLLGVVVGAFGHWYLTQPGAKTTVADARDLVSTNMANLSRSVRDTIDVDKIKDELARTGKVIREKARKTGEVVAEATADGRITAAVKAKLINDPTLSALKINVDTTDGVVTLSGTVSSHEEIGKAIDLAMSVEGVQKVISTLQVKP